MWLRGIVVMGFFVLSPRMRQTSPPRQRQPWIETASPEARYVTASRPEH